jgi:hypothetical protein
MSCQTNVSLTAPTSTYDYSSHTLQVDLQGQVVAEETIADSGLNCLLLEQLDPLEAKRSAIQALLRGPGPEIPETVVATAIDRDNLLKALQLFGRNFQHHVPLLHAPTFNLSTAPSVLVLAMFVVGACYADIVRPTSYIFPMVMRVLVHIEQQPVIFPGLCDLL